MMTKKLQGIFLNAFKNVKTTPQALQVNTENKTAETNSAESTQMVTQADSLPQKAETAPTDTIIATTEFVGDISDYDRAVETNMPARIHSDPALYKKTRLIIDGKGRTLLAWINEDETGNRIISVVQQYKTGSRSPIFQLSQGDVVISAMATPTVDDTIQNKVKKTILKTGERYLNTFRGQADEVMNMHEIVRMLFLELAHIPVYMDGSTEAERAEFHKLISDFIQGLSSMILNTHTLYYPLTDEEIQEVAQNTGLTKINLLKKLKKYDLLYQTPSSKGYQTNVRMNGMGADSYTAWRYCVLRNVEMEHNGDEYDGYDF